MKHNHKIGDRVTFKCHILGTPRGTIKSFKKCISNGQMHAEIELLPPHVCNETVTEPVINLVQIA